MSFKRLRVALIASATTLLLSSAAFAADGYILQSGSLLAGPDYDYPPIAHVTRGWFVDVIGCTRDYDWCDIAFGPMRGWYPGDNIAFETDGGMAPAREVGPLIGLIILDFMIEDYWHEHYVDRPWYHDRRRWFDHPPGRPPQPDWDHRPQEGQGEPPFGPNHRPWHQGDHWPRPGGNYLPPPDGQPHLPGPNFGHGHGQDQGQGGQDQPGGQGQPGGQDQPSGQGQPRTREPRQGVPDQPPKEWGQRQRGGQEPRQGLPNQAQQDWGQGQRPLGGQERHLEVPEPRPGIPHMPQMESPGGGQHFPQSGGGGGGGFGGKPKKYCPPGQTCD